MAELGRATFGEDKQRAFKSVVDCFEKIGQERFVESYILIYWIIYLVAVLYSKR